MKSLKLALFGAALAAFTGSASAESTVTVSGVHNCCGGCAKGITSAITGAGATAKVEGKSVVISASDDATLKKAASALIAAGYYGQGLEAPAVTDAKVKSASVGGVHLCCGKCVTAVEKAVKSVPGVTGHTASKGAETFTVSGDFSTKELAAALNKEGFAGSIK